MIKATIDIIIVNNKFRDCIYVFFSNLAMTVGNTNLQLGGGHFFGLF